MLRFKRNRVKKAAAAIMAAVCVMMAAAPVYADGPSGPASDTSVAADTAKKAEGPSGPASDIQQPTQPEQQPTQPEQQPTQPDQQPTQPEQQPTQPEQQPTQPEQQPTQPESTEGLIASGGRYIDPSKPMIALTFDDGPYAPVGNRIMDSLEQHNGRATFFVVGNRVSSYQTEIKRMHDNGHEIGNHTYEHKYLNKLNATQIRSQIDRCNEAVAAVTGEAPTLVRLPGGNKNNTVLANVNYPMIMWNIDTLDWKTKNADKTVDAVLGHVKDGDIVLMHELYTASGDAAVRIIPALSEQGYQLVTVSELARFRGGVKSGGLYYSFHK